MPPPALPRGSIVLRSRRNTDGLLRATGPCPAPDQAAAGLLCGGGRCDGCPGLGRFRQYHPALPETGAAWSETPQCRSRGLLAAGRSAAPPDILFEMDLGPAPVLWFCGGGLADYRAGQL